MYSLIALVCVTLFWKLAVAAYKCRMQRDATALQEQVRPPLPALLSLTQHATCDAPQVAATGC
jgi:hypothetical protein